MHYDLLVSAGTHTQAKLGVQNWGFICLIGLEMLWPLCGKVFLHEVERLVRRRESLCVPLHEGQCA